MKQKLMILLLCMLILFVAGYFKGWLLPSLGLEETSNNQQEQITNTQLEVVEYNKDGIAAEYPKFISGGSEQELNNWNKIISSDFDKILHIYAFNPIPGPTPAPPATVPVILNINYDLKMNNQRLTSIFYRAAFHSSFSAYPTDLVYTTNIDKEKNRRIRLKDVVVLNQDFVKEFRTWDFIPFEEGNVELNQAIRDYISNISDEDLLKGFETADQIGSTNSWGIYSYYTPGKLGISVGVPNYAGDHVEFEKEYSKIQKYLQPDYKILAQ